MKQFIRVVQTYRDFIESNIWLMPLTENHKNNLFIKVKTEKLGHGVKVLDARFF